MPTESHLIQAIIVLAAISGFLVVAVIQAIFYDFKKAFCTLSFAYLILSGGFAWHTREMRDLHNVQQAEIDRLYQLIK